MSDIDKRIKEGARTIAGDLAGPAGQIALDRVVARHLDWFELCQQRGMSWPQICGALHQAGAGRETGLPFSHGHLSAVVWRQRRKDVKAMPPAQEEIRGCKGEPSRPARKRARDPALPATMNRLGATDPGAATGAPPEDCFAAMGGVGTSKRSPSNDDTFEAYLKRAANIRRKRSEDD